MEKRQNKKRVLGWVLLIFSILFFVSTEIGIKLQSKPEVCAKQVQNKIQKTEQEITTFMESNPELEQYKKKELGLIVFKNDSLLFWNTNAIGPKLVKRKVIIGNDTICNLLSGDYYIKSLRKGQLDYYVFKRLNTTYKLENQYLVNRLELSNPFINLKVRFDNQPGFEIKSINGKTLAWCQITDAPQLREPYKEILIGLNIFLFFIGLILILSKTKEKKSKFKIQYGIWAILIVSLVLTYLYDKANIKQENLQMASMAEILSEKRDPNFESSFQQFQAQIPMDTTLREMLFAESNVLADVILGYSKELLFDATMRDYIVSLTVCQPEEEITIQPENYVTDCDDYFLEKLSENEQKRVGEGLYFIDYYTLDPNYLGKIKAYSKDSLQQKTLYFEFYKPIAPEGFGFPQLLQENNSTKPYKYSVANYRDNVLVYKYGKYIYPSFLRDIKTKNADFSYEKGYKHYSIKIDDNNALIISTERKGWSELTAPFAQFFIVLLVPYLLICWLIRPKENVGRKNRSFRQRLQTVVFLTLAISFLVIGPVSVLYMRSLYHQKTTESQFETTRTLAAEINNDLDVNALVKNASRAVWTEILQHYATTFFTDLNLYSFDGRLIATTRQEIYELTLQAPIMNAEAFQQMHKNKMLYFSHEERIGKGTYESAYIPMTNEQGNTLAYLNTPYFSSETDLHNEIKNFVLTYININLILLGIALGLILRITKRLTQPLSLIQSNMRDVKIDQKNEPIEWKNNDEIGALVKQYNQLIVELEKSAAELKRTTAESAWRGVARQVAHEIKNSLTPMRLSVQMLQRNIDSGKATPVQIQHTNNTLIEQIDALSDIASSFSRYAKLPENHPAPFDLAELVGNVVTLYDNEENITFNFSYDKTKDHTYNGDKTNLNSAVGNLIKNAVQAIGTKPDGRVEVSLSSTEKAFIISVKDNGKGIKEEDKERIFLPNFTTKTGGSGIGLSLTYNIVQAAGGTISFDSQEGQGAEFVIELPKN